MEDKGRPNFNTTFNTLNVSRKGQLVISWKRLAYCASSFSRKRSCRGLEQVVYTNVARS